MIANNATMLNLKDSIKTIKSKKCFIPIQRLGLPSMHKPNGQSKSIKMKL